MTYWYLAATGAAVYLAVDAWGNWINDDGEVVNVDNAGNVTNESGDWLGTVYGDTTDFLADTRDAILEIPADALKQATITVPVTLAATTLILVWYFFRR